MKELNELKQLLISKIDKMEEKYENKIKDNENIIQELRDNENKMKNELAGYRKELQYLKNIQEQEKKDIEKNIRFQMLNEMIFIEDQDLEFNLPLKKRNCFHVKDVQKARELGGIATLNDLIIVIDNNEFQDIIEVKNTLICLESVIDEWKNDKLKLDDLDQEIPVKQDFSEWKLKEHSILTQFIFDHLDNKQFKDFNIIKSIDNDFYQMGKAKRGKIIEDIYKNIIDSIIIEWKTKDIYDDEVKEFIQMIPHSNKQFYYYQFHLVMKYLIQKNQVHHIHIPHQHLLNQNL